MSLFYLLTGEIAELLDQSDNGKDGSSVDKLLADVRSGGYASSKLSDGNFSVTKVTKVSLHPSDKVNGVSDMTDGSTRQQRRSMGSSIEDLFSSCDSLAHKRNRRSYAFGDNESLLNFLKDTSGSSSELDKIESRSERYSSLRRRRLERTGRKSSIIDAYESGRERSSLTNLTDINISSPSVDSTIAGVKMRQLSSAKNERPKSEVFSDDSLGSYPLRRSQSFLEKSTLDRRQQLKDDDNEDESEALIRRLNQKLGRGSGRETPAISEENGELAAKENSSLMDSTPMGRKRSRWRNGINISDDNSPSTRMNTYSFSMENIATKNSDKTSEKVLEDKSSQFINNVAPAQPTCVVQNVESSSPSETPRNLETNSDPAQNQSYSVSMRKQISKEFGTDIDGILKTIEDTGRQIDTVGVTGPMKRTPGPNNNPAQPQVAIVAHVTASHHPTSPVIDTDLKVKKDNKKASSTASVKPMRILSDSIKDIKRVNNTNNSVNRTRSGNFVRRSASVPRTPPPPQVRLCKSTMRSENEKLSGNSNANNKKEVAKTGKVEPKNKVKDSGSKAHNGHQESKVNNARSADKTAAGRANLANKMVNSALQAALVNPVVKRNNANRLSVDGRRKGLCASDTNSDSDGGRVKNYPDTLAIDSTNTSTETLQAISPVLQPNNHLENIMDDSESPVAAIAKWKMKRAQQRRSMGDLIDETDNVFHFNNSPASSVKNEAGSRFSYASNNDKDEGFETSSGTVSERTSMNSVLEADIQNNPALRRLADNAKQNSSAITAHSPSSETFDNNADVFLDDVLSPESEQGTIGTETVASTSSTKSSTHLNQKEASTLKKPSNANAKPGKPVPSYMQPTSSSSSRPARARISSSTSADTAASVSVIKRNTPSRASMRDQEPGPPLKRDAVRASMRAETESASFQRGSLARTSVRGPRSSLSVSSSSSSNSLLAPSSPGRSRLAPSTSMSSLASSTSNLPARSSGVSVTPNRRLSSTSSTGAPIYRPTTPSFRSTTPTPQTSASSKKPTVVVSQTKTPAKSSQKSSGFSRTQSVRASSGRTSMGSTPALNTDGRRSVTPFTNDNSRSSTPSLPDRPQSTTPMLSEGKSSRRSSFMAPTAASRAKAEELSPAVPERTQSLTSIASTSSFTRQGSLRVLNKSSTTNSGRKSPANTLLSPHGKPEHYQSLSTVAEQAGDEDKDNNSVKRSPSIIKRIIGRSKGSYPVSKTPTKPAGTVTAVKK